MSNFDPTAIEYRVGSVSMNAVKAMREVYGRDDGAFLDADTAAIKAIEAILHGLPRASEYAHLEARPLVSTEQPKANTALKTLRADLEKTLADELAELDAATRPSRAR